MTVTLVAVATVLLLCAADNLQEVNTLIGTGGIGYGVGEVPPGPQVPFGMMRLTPDTTEDTIYQEQNHNGGYYYDNTIVRCFSHTHMVGAGAPDLGHIGVMPVTKPVTATMVKDYGFKSSFSHATEVALPGYMALSLTTWDVRVELTASTHVGVHRYTFPNGVPRSVLFYASHAIKPRSARQASADVNVTAQEVTGYSIIDGALSSRFGGAKVYYVAKFSAAFTAYGTWTNDTVTAGSASVEGGSVGAYVSFGGSDALTLETRVAISFVSLEQARVNLAAQAPASESFSIVQNATQALWREHLGDANITGGASVDRQKFFSALYRTKLAPTHFSEEGGAYLGFDKQVHTVDPGHIYYSDMSIWDVHRTEIPLITATRPDISADIMRSLLRMAEQGGDLPRWPLANGYTHCMIGTHANLMIVDALLKGATGFNVSEAYEYMYLQATEPREANGRSDIQDYLAKGYVCADKQSRAASLTLAYAFDDWAVATVASVLGRTADAAMFLHRAQNNYKNIWNPSRKIFCGKTCAGTWDCPLDDFQWGKLYVEGNALQWRWFVPQDIPGLVALFGGATEFAAQLNEFIDKSRLDPTDVLPNPYYWAGNEPDILAPWMFVPAGRADLTQKWTRWLVQNKFTDGGNGLPGNDDYGTMSAWELWAYLGLYPLAGSDVYFLGAPFFPQATVRFGGSTLTIVAHNAGPANYVVQRVNLNGTPVANATVTHASLVGSTLEFWMAAPS